MKNELELSVNKLELGTLTTNAIAVRDKVKDLLNNFKAENYTEDNIDKAKEDKAIAMIHNEVVEMAEYWKNKYLEGEKK